MNKRILTISLATLFGLGVAIGALTLDGNKLLVNAESNLEKYILIDASTVTNIEGNDSDNVHFDVVTKCAFDTDLDFEIEDLNALDYYGETTTFHIGGSDLVTVTTKDNSKMWYVEGVANLLHINDSFTKVSYSYTYSFAGEEKSGEYVFNREVLASRSFFRYDSQYDIDYVTCYTDNNYFEEADENVRNIRIHEIKLFYTC